MIKHKIYLILLLTLANSCSFISYNQVIPLIKEATFGAADIELSEEFILEQSFSFARVDLGKGANIIMVLQEINSNFYTWVSSTGEKMITYNGKIVRTEGLIYNIEIINPNDFKLLSLSGESKGTFNLMLKNPQAFIEQEFYISNVEDTVDYLLFEEKVFTAILSAEQNNFYWLDKKLGRIVKTKQAVHPNLSKIRIDFVYKF